jgi:hypothetical protein
MRRPGREGDLSANAQSCAGQLVLSANRHSVSLTVAAEAYSEVVRGSTRQRDHGRVGQHGEADRTGPEPHEKLEKVHSRRLFAVELSERLRRLSSAGIEAIEIWRPGEIPVTPVEVVWAATGCGPDSGRLDRPVDDSDPDRIRKGNAAWLELARQFSLFDDEGSFLLAVPTEKDTGGFGAWFRVRLAGRWDLVGRGAEARVLGGGWGVPEFWMHSIDGEVLLGASWFESCFNVIAIPEPYSVGVLRRQAEILLEESAGAIEDRKVIRPWLARGRIRKATGNSI